MSEQMSRRELLQNAAAGAVAMAGVAEAAEGEATADRPAIVAIAGAAHIHIPSFVNMMKARKDVKVKSVYDHDAARAQKRGDEVGAAVVKSPDEIWSDPQVKAVVIGSETNRHPQLVAGAARSGKHMFVEKPLGITGKESVEMADAIEKAGVLFTTGYMYRTFAPYLFAKEQVAKGTLGKITRVRGSMCHEGSLGGWFDSEWRWMADPQQAGVGAFGDLGTHMLDLLMWLVGDIEAVTAQTKVVTGRYGQCDESGEGLIRFKNGAVGTLAAGWVDVANPLTLLISGTEGHLAIVNEQVLMRQPKVAGADGRTPWKKLPEGQPHPMEQFLNAICGKPNQALVTPREAAARVVAMEAMYRGAKENKWVDIAPN